MRKEGQCLSKEFGIIGSNKDFKLVFEPSKFEQFFLYPGFNLTRPDQEKFLQFTAIY